MHTEYHPGYGGGVPDEQQEQLMFQSMNLQAPSFVPGAQEHAGAPQQSVP